MVVNTGHRTRDWATANSYSMNAFGEDQQTRLYVCMRSAGVLAHPTVVPDSIGNYRALAKTTFDCGTESDGGWPRDIGFLRCIQRKFNADFHKSNLFLACLDHTEGVMVENIQTDASTLFLGSYNFVAFLIAAMGVMTAFLIFTAGGWFIGNVLRHDSMHVNALDRDGYDRVDPKTKELMKVTVPSGYMYIASYLEWAPLSALPNFLALLWSLVLFGASMWLTYPQRGMWGDTVSIDGGASSFPGTPWTGNLCSGVTFVMSMYFASCLFEWYYDRESRLEFNKRRKFEVDNKRANYARVAEANKANTENPERTTQLWNRQFPPPPNVTDAPPGFTMPSDSYGAQGNLYADVSNLYSKFSIQNADFRHFPVHLGTRFNYQLYYEDNGNKSMYLRMAPLLNKVFTLAWVFTDCLLFIGMINSQNSPLNENIVNIWYYIAVCRGFQLAAAYFMDDVLFSYTKRKMKLSDGINNTNTVRKKFNNPDNYENETMSKYKAFAGNGYLPVTSAQFFLGPIFDVDPQTRKIMRQNGDDLSEIDNYVESIDKKSEEILSKNNIQAIHAAVSAACCHIASFWCMVLVLYHFVNAMSIPFHINSSSSVSAVQITFIVLMMAMDIFKHVVGFNAIFGKLNQDTYCLMLQITYTLDNLIRAVLIICGLFPVTDYLGSISKGLESYVVLATS